MSAPLATTFLQSESFIYVLYIVAFALFIQGLRGLSGPTTAVRGNRTAAVGMAIAVVETLLNPGEGDWGLIVLGLALGTAVGVPAARNVKMTAMPQMVALFNGVGGGAVALISWVEFRHYSSTYGSQQFHLVGETGSVVITAGGPPDLCGNLLHVRRDGRLIPFWAPTSPRQAPGNRPRAPELVRLGPAGGQPRAADPGARRWRRPGGGAHSELLFIGMLIVAALLGNAVVLPIGGADMPVVISMLNAFTGLSAAATGMALDNPALIVAGDDRGASGTILTNLMATAMNRSIPAIVAGGFGGGGAVEGASGAGEHAGTVRSTTAADAAIQLAYASRVVVVPGYRMAVGRPSTRCASWPQSSRSAGWTSNTRSIPVAGRMPGHMNVLLAEADVPYDQLKEMDDINPEFQRTDVSLVIGANDVTNPAAKNTPSSPIYGMPILEVADSRSVIVIKRSMNPGFAGIENELYFDPEDRDAVRRRQVRRQRDHRRARPSCRPRGARRAQACSRRHDLGVLSQSMRPVQLCRHSPIVCIRRILDGSLTCIDH